MDMVDLGAFSPDHSSAENLAELFPEIAQTWNSGLLPSDRSQGCTSNISYIGMQFNCQLGIQFGCGVLVGLADISLAALSIVFASGFGHGLWYHDLVLYLLIVI